MLWIKEVEMVESVDDLEASRSIGGHRFPNFEMLDAKIASSLKKITTNPFLKKRVNLEEQNGRVEILAISVWNSEFPIQAEGEPRGAKNTNRRPLSTRKTDRLRLLLSD